MSRQYKGNLVDVFMVVMVTVVTFRGLPAVICYIFSNPWRGL